MKKQMLMAVCAVFAAGSLFAYNPPAGAQNLLRYSSPFALVSANSTAGGALLDVIPSSVVTNPALTAFEQRVAIDVGGTFLMDSDDTDGDIGSAFQLGIAIPTRWAVPSFLVQGIFAPLIDMNLANNIAFTANIAKDINDKVSIGLNATFSKFWNDYKGDWSLAANTGVYFNYGDLFFMKDLRFAVTLMNLGKMYDETTAAGIQKTNGKHKLASAWPGVLTPRTGVATTLVDTGDFKIGASVDFGFPTFQDFVLDAGVALQYSGFSFGVIKLASAWEFDALEFVEGSKNILPSVGLSVKFNFSADNEALANRGWAESEITAAGAWKQLYENVNAISAGAVLKLGMEDKDPPVITLWGED